MAVGIVGALWLCAPLIIGLMFSVTSRTQYNAERPRQTGSLAITNAGITLSLWTKQQPRAICYEGDYRILQVSRPGKADEYYPLLPSLVGDDPDVSVYWLPEQECIRLVDVGMRRLPKESIIDLRNHRITDVDRVTNGTDTIYEPRNPMNAMNFPKAGDRWSISSALDPVQLPTGQAVRIGTLYKRMAETNTCQPATAECLVSGK